MDKNVRSMQFAMGTVIAHQAFGARAPEAARFAQSEIKRLEGQLSRFRTDSELGEVNRCAGISHVPVSEDTFCVLTQAVTFSRCSGGRYDLTVGPLLSLWKRCGERGLPPGDEQIGKARALVDWTDVRLDHDSRTVALRRAGQSIDLGGIGKGFAADRVREIYRERGVASAFVNLGGNVVALGARPDGAPWRVGIRHPRKEGEIIGVVSATSTSVVTSGDYERRFVDRDGTQYHHIVDPATGRPSASGLSSVTIVAESSTDADALSTIVFLAGREDGLDVVRSRPGVEAVLVDMGERVYVTPGLRDRLQVARGVDAVFV